MALVTLRPIATTNSAQLPPFGAATAHAALSDQSDLSDCRAQVTATEPVKSAWHVGPGGLTALPPEADRITGTVVNIRGLASDDVGAATINITAGDYPNTRVSGSRFTNGTGDGAISTTSTASLTFWTKFTQIQASGWIASVNYDSGHQGVQGQIMDIWFDVTWEPTLSVFKALFFGLGPLTALLHREVPGLVQEIWRRTGVRIFPHEYELLLRAIREERWPSYVLL